MASVLNEPYFQSEAAAFERLEAIVWPNGPTCPHCGNMDKFYVLSGVRSKPSKKNPEGVVRHGLKKCAACRGQFTVRSGTVFEESHVALHLWFQATYLMCSSKKGVSANQLHRTLGVALQTGWFMGHRIREAMRSGGLAPPMGGKGKFVEIDETFIGRKEGAEVRRGGAHKNIVLSLVERGGPARSFHVGSTKKEDIIPIVKANIHRETHVMTDESNTYVNLNEYFAKHGVVDHSRKEYAYTDRVSGTSFGINSAEGYYSVFKRGMKGIYQHCKEKHLHRYVAEFDFRHSNRVRLGIDDMDRTVRALRGIVGKRLTYRDSSKTGA
jgi:transposase-like protein